MFQVVLAWNFAFTSVVNGHPKSGTDPSFNMQAARCTLQTANCHGLQNCP